MSNPDISVVLTAYNRAELLPRAIESVIAQDDAAFELMIIDDASTDGTGAYLATLTDPRIKVKIADRNLGPSGARNLGLELAAAPVVAFLDSDDRYLPHRLSAPLAALAADLDVVCVLSSARKFDREVARDANSSYETHAPAFEWALLCDLIPVEATSITVRRDVARTAGGFCANLRLTEDRELLVRVAKHGGCRLIDEILWEKSWSESGLSMNWSGAAKGLVAYARERPEILTQYPKLGSYMATKILVSHIRDRRYGMLLPDFNTLRNAGLISANPIREILNHLEVKKYRRVMSNTDRAFAIARSAGGMALTRQLW